MDHRGDPLSLSLLNLLPATVAAFWSISCPASMTMVLDLVLVLFVTALVLGSAGQHAVV